MNILRTLAALADELIESLDAAALRGERAVRRALQCAEHALAAAIWRLRTQRLRRRLDELCVTESRRWADEILAANGERAESGDMLDRIREVREQLAVARRRLEEALR